MNSKFNADEFFKKFPHTLEKVQNEEINIEKLAQIYEDYINCRFSYESQADFIANILRSQKMVHTVKSRIKEPDRLIEKIII